MTRSIVRRSPSSSKRDFNTVLVELHTMLKTQGLTGGNIKKVNQLCKELETIRESQATA